MAKKVNCEVLAPSPMKNEQTRIKMYPANFCSRMIETAKMQTKEILTIELPVMIRVEYFHLLLILW